MHRLTSKPARDALRVARVTYVPRTARCLLRLAYLRTCTCTCLTRLHSFLYNANGAQYDMVFTSVLGHLMELEFEARYKKWRGCSPAELYHAGVLGVMVTVERLGVYGMLDKLFVTTSGAGVGSKI